VPDLLYFDLFISYSRDDNRQGQISEIVARIQKEYRDFTGGGEPRIFFDKREFATMDDWRQNTLEPICLSRLLLVCLSPNYLQSEYCSWELNQYLGHKAAHAPVAENIVYFVEIPACSDKGFEQRAAGWVAELRLREHFEFRPWFDEGAADLKEAAVKDLLDNSEAQTQEEISRIRRLLDTKGNMDRRNDQFVGRTTELSRLREMVASRKTSLLTIITGPEGIGKTALAVEYGHRFAHEYAGGCWQVCCGGREDLRVALASLAGVYNLDFSFTEEEKRDLDLGLERVLSELKQHADSAKPSRVLLLLDNVDQPKLLEPDQVRRLPRVEWLHIIVTTKLDEYELFGKQKDRAFVTLSELPEGEGLALVERYQPGGKFPDQAARGAALNIVQWLGGFTLALERAAVFLGQSASDLNCISFRDQLRGEGLTNLEEDEKFDDGSSYFKKCLSAALGPTLRQLDEAERLTLIFASLLPADHVALPWLRALVTQEFPELGENPPLGSSGRWLALLERLFSLRLLQNTAERNEARMHRLVQEVVKLDAGAKIVAARERALLAHVKARAEFLWEGWVRHEYRWELVPLVASAWQLLERGDNQGVYLANQAFGPLRNLGNFAEAEPLLRRALTLDEQSFGLNNPNVATCLNNLAALLHDTNRLEEAEILYRRALAIDEQSFGSNDPKIATCLNNLALLLKASGRLREAEPLYRRALAVDEQSFGPDHPRVATHLNNLAQLLQATDRPEEAEPFYRRALAIDQEVLGPNHPRIASHLNNLAQLLQAIDRLEEAEPLYRRALAIDEQSFGPDHPRVATHLNNLASLLKATDRLEEAEQLYRRALGIDERSFGWDHPNVGTDLNNLAALLEATNRLEEAEQLMQRMLGIFLRFSASTGREHPFLQTATRNYAALLAELGRDSGQILARLNNLTRRFGISFGSDALREIAMESPERRLPRSTAAITGYRTALIFLLRKVFSFFGLTSSKVSREEQQRNPKDRP
jgi:tetratricopeptide (TPR) repeat protein